MHTSSQFQDRLRNVSKMRIQKKLRRGVQNTAAQRRIHRRVGATADFLEGKMELFSGILRKFAKDVIRDVFSGGIYVIKVEFKKDL